jgi:hypothetical protein
MWNVESGQQTVFTHTLPTSCLSFQCGMVASIALGRNNKLAVGLRLGLVTVFDTSRPGEKVELPVQGGVIGGSVACRTAGAVLPSGIGWEGKCCVEDYEPQRSEACLV